MPNVLTEPASLNAQEVRLVLFSYIDENVQVVYSPALDLYGYGNDEEEARQSFSVVLEEYLDYARENGTFLEDLTRLGWQIDAGSQAISEPSIEYVLRQNPDFNEVLTRRALKTYHRIVRIDAFKYPA